MSRQFEAVNRDIYNVNKEIRQNLEQQDAIRLLSSGDPEATDLHNTTIYGAIQTLAKADSADIKGDTLDEVLDYLQDCETGLREELASFYAKHDELLVRNRADVMRWIDDELDRLQEFPYDPTVTDDTRPDRIKLLNQVKEQFQTIREDE